MGSPPATTAPPRRPPPLPRPARASTHLAQGVVDHLGEEAPRLGRVDAAAGDLDVVVGVLGGRSSRREVHGGGGKCGRGEKLDGGGAGPRGGQGRGDGDRAAASLHCRPLLRRTTPARLTKNSSTIGSSANAGKYCRFSRLFDMVLLLLAAAAGCCCWLLPLLLALAPDADGAARLQLLPASLALRRRACMRAATELPNYFRSLLLDFEPQAAVRRTGNRQGFFRTPRRGARPAREATAAETWCESRYHLCGPAAAQFTGPRCSSASSTAGPPTLDLFCEVHAKVLVICGSREELSQCLWSSFVKIQRNHRMLVLIGGLGPSKRTIGVSSCRLSLSSCF